MKLKMRKIVSMLACAISSSAFASSAIRYDYQENTVQINGLEWTVVCISAYTNRVPDWAQIIIERYSIITAVSGFESTPDMVVPDDFNGYKVVALAVNMHGNKEITSAYLPKFYSPKFKMDYPQAEALLKCRMLGFSGCENLTNIVFEKDCPITVLEAFSGCTNLKEIKFPNCVEQLSGMAFEGCSSLTNVIFNEGLISIGNRAFLGCNKLTEWEIPSTVTSIGECAFHGTPLISTFVGKVLIKDGCWLVANDLEFFTQEDWDSLIVSRTDLRVVADQLFWAESLDMDDWPNKYFAVTNFSFPHGVVAIGSSCFGYQKESCDAAEVLDSIQETLEKPRVAISIPSTLTRIGSDSFCGMNLQSIEIGDAYTTIAKSDMSMTFGFCRIETITAHNIQTLIDWIRGGVARHGF